MEAIYIVGFILLGYLIGSSRIRRGYELINSLNLEVYDK